MGIGTIPDAVLSFLGNHKNLGVHTEMLSDGIIDLVEKDVINNKCKCKHPNKTITSFAIGSRRLYDYVNDNSSFNFLDIDYVNNPHVIRQNPKVIAINSAIEVDLTGQVCADSIGELQYSGIGGQMDFMRGAALSVGGKCNYKKLYTLELSNVTYNHAASYDGLPNRDFFSIVAGINF